MIVIRFRGQDEPVFIPIFQLDLAALKRAGADFRALQIGENGDWNAGFALDLADGLGHIPEFVVIAMTHIEPENINAGVKQKPQHGWRGTGGADGRDNFAKTVSHGAAG